MLFGAVSDRHWLPVESAAAPHPRRHEVRTLHADPPAWERAGAGRPPRLSGPCSNPRSGHRRYVPQVDADVIAVSADWDALPRTPSVHCTRQRAYRGLVCQSRLRAEGYGRMRSMNITQLLRINFGRDDAAEVLVAAVPDPGRWDVLLGPATALWCCCGGS